MLPLGTARAAARFCRFLLNFPRFLTRYGKGPGIYPDTLARHHGQRITASWCRLPVAGAGCRSSRPAGAGHQIKMMCLKRFAATQDIVLPVHGPRITVR